MAFELETAAEPQKLRRIAIDPISRVEGHGKITLLMDDAGYVQQARLHIVEFRGFERFIQGRPYWEAPVMVQRLCGICPVSHHLAASKALDAVVGANPIPAAAPPFWPSLAASVGMPITWPSRSTKARRCRRSSSSAASRARRSAAS